MTEGELKLVEFYKHEKPMFSTWEPEKVLAFKRQNDPEKFDRIYRRFTAPKGVESTPEEVVEPTGPQDMNPSGLGLPGNPQTDELKAKQDAEALADFQSGRTSAEPGEQTPVAPPVNGKKEWEKQHPARAVLERISEDVQRNPGLPYKALGVLGDIVAYPGKKLEEKFADSLEVRATTYPFKKAKEGYEQIETLGEKAHKANYQILGDILTTVGNVGKDVTPKGPTDLILALMLGGRRGAPGYVERGVKGTAAKIETVAAMGEGVAKKGVGQSIVDFLSSPVDLETAKMIKAPVDVRTAENIAKSLRTKSPEAHGKMGKTILEELEKKSRSSVDLAYKKMDSYLENRPQTANRLLESAPDAKGMTTNNLTDTVRKVSAPLDLVPEVLQDSVLKRFMQAAPTTGKAPIVNILDDIPGLERGPRMGVPQEMVQAVAEPTYTVQEAIALRKRLSAQYGRSMGTTTGHYIKELIKAVDKDLLKFAPEVSEIHKTVMGTAKKFYDSWGENTVGNKALKVSKENLHKALTGSIDDIEALRRAGAKGALVEAKMAHGFEIVNKITSANMTGQQVLEMFTKNRVLNHLFTKKEIKGFMDTADTRIRAQQTNIVSGKAAEAINKMGARPTVGQALGRWAKRKIGLGGQEQGVIDSLK